MQEKAVCPHSCLCEHCARILTCVDCIYFPWSIGRGCSEGGTTDCRYLEEVKKDDRGQSAGR